MFSEPVPRSEFPEYYEMIKKPMDYGTMKEKLEGGAYRSVQAMQKDFVLIMANCLEFNAADSDIVMRSSPPIYISKGEDSGSGVSTSIDITSDKGILWTYHEGI